MTLYAGVRLRARVHMPHPAPSPRRLHWRSNVAMSLHAALSHRFPSFGAAAISEAVALLVANDVLSLDDIRTAPDCSSWAGSEASGRARARAPPRRARIRNRGQAATACDWYAQRNAAPPRRGCRRPASAGPHRVANGPVPHGASATTLLLTTAVKTAALRTHRRAPPRRPCAAGGRTARNA